MRNVDISRWASGSRISRWPWSVNLLSGSMIVCLVFVPDFCGIARSNQATARMLGLTAPDKPLATADEALELLQPVHVVCRGA